MTALIKDNIVWLSRGHKLSDQIVIEPNLKQEFIIVCPTRVDPGQLSGHPVVFSHVEGMHGGQTRQQCYKTFFDIPEAVFLVVCEPPMNEL